MPRTILSAFISILLAALVLALVAPPAFSGDAVPQDVLGWQDTTWGMSSDQIVSLFGESLQKLDKRMDYEGAYVDYIIPKYELVDSTFTVRFQMAEAADSLQQIFIMLDDTKLPENFLYDELESLLTRRYGQAPTYSDDSADGSIFSRNREWVFPTTTIGLLYFYTRGVGSGALSIVYSQTAAGDVGKL
jgi:hypothetical protein